MKSFFGSITVIFIFIAAYSPCFAQTCKVNITGKNCLGDTLHANFTGSTLSNLVWMWTYQNIEQPYFYANIKTAAGGNDSGSASNQLNNLTTVFADVNGNIYVADAANNRIQKWLPGTTHV